MLYVMDVLIKSVDEVSCVDVSGELGMSLVDLHVLELRYVFLHLD